MYKHSNDDTSNIETADNNNGDKIKSLTIEIYILKSRLAKRKEENHDKNNKLARIYLFEVSKS